MNHVEWNHEFSPTGNDAVVSGHVGLQSFMNERLIVLAISTVCSQYCSAAMKQMTGKTAK